jgi:hypothetical protein
MNRKRTAPAAAVLVLALLSFAAPAGAAVSPCFTTENQDVPVGTGGSLSVVLDETLDVRTVEVWAEYNASVLASADGQPGALFTASGCPLFKPRAQIARLRLA